MTPTIQTLDEKQVLFVRKTGRYDESAQQAWGALFAFAQKKGLQMQPPDMIGISHDSPGVTKEEHCRYDACIPAAKGVGAEGEVAVQTIPGGKYAVFLHEGDYSQLKDTYSSIFSQWYPNSGEALREIPCFEVYLNSMFNTAPADLKTEIYIPLQS